MYPASPTVTAHPRYPTKDQNFLSCITVYKIHFDYTAAVTTITMTPKSQHLLALEHTTLHSTSQAARTEHLTAHSPFSEARTTARESSPEHFAAQSSLHGERTRSGRSRSSSLIMVKGRDQDERDTAVNARLEVAFARSDE